MILHRYFALRFLRVFLGIATAIFLIMFSLDLTEQIRRYGGDGTEMSSLIALSMLNIPKAFYEVLPLLVLLTSVTLFIGSARSSEMVVTRAAGRSAIEALFAPVAMTLLVGVLAVTLLNPIVASTSKEYEARIDLLRGDTRSLLVGDSGLWLRQGTAAQQTVIHARNANLDGTRLSDVTFVSFGVDGAPLTRIEAGSAELQGGAWALRDTKVWPLGTGGVPEDAAQILPVFELQSDLTPDQIRNSFGTPSSIPIWELPAFIERLRGAGLSANRHLVFFHSELSAPLFLVGMLLIGAAFTMRHQRGGRTGLMVMTAIVLAFVIYFIRNFAKALGDSGQLPVSLAAYAIPIAAIGLALTLLLHNEDG